jgi:uncharacterized protein
MKTKIKKTKFASYCLNGIPEGCKRCIQGKKTVLFITGKCSRNCVYCPLSNKRKNSDNVWANEKLCKSTKEVIYEIKESNSNSCSITGGDPLVRLKRTLIYAKAIKRKFPKFHIHIYLSTKLVNKKNLKKLSKVIDEVRFHPEFLSIPKKMNKDIEKIKLAKIFWRKENIGIEMPIFSDKKKETLDFIYQISKDIGFVNLNELEIGDTNFNFIIKKYKLNKNGYTIKGSLEAGKWILSQLGKSKTKLFVHLCSAETKNWHQYKNRLKAHKIIKFGKKTNEGTVIYFALKNNKIKPKINKSSFYFDKLKKRRILNPKIVRQLASRYKILRIEEYPTHDRDEVEVEELFHSH